MTPLYNDFKILFIVFADKNSKYNKTYNYIICFLKRKILEKLASKAKNHKASIFLLILNIKKSLLIFFFI